MPRKASGMPKVKEVHRPQKNGDIYVYEVTTLYNPDKKYNEQVSSRLLGKIPSGGTEIVPTRPRVNKNKPSTTAARKNTDTTDILEWIGRESGIDDDVRNATDEGTAEKIISLARYWVTNKDKSIHRIEEWQIEHTLPYEDGLSEDMCYSLMHDIGHDVSISQNYFLNRAGHASTGASVAVDTTTISSYSENLNDVRFGYNKDGNGLATVKLLTLFATGDEYQQPIAFSRQPGNIPDVISVLNVLKQMSVLGLEKPLVVLDGGFFSEQNILGFMHAHTKFVMRGQIDGKWILPALEKKMNSFEKPSHICPYDPNIYGVTCLVNHEFSWIREENWGDSMKGDTVLEKHRVYLHFFLNTEKARIDRSLFLREIQKVKDQIEHGVDISMMSKSERDITDKYLVIRKYGKKITVLMNDKAIEKETRYYGYFVLVSNNAMDTFSALREYQRRERTEEGFRIDKQFNDSHVTRAKSTASLDGRFFCQFVAFGYEEYLRNAINRIKKALAVKNGDPEHDTSKVLRKEKALLTWLNKMSISKLLDWYDAVQETTAKNKFGRNRWKTESVERDHLFLQKLGVIKS